MGRSIKTYRWGVNILRRTIEGKKRSAGFYTPSSDRSNLPIPGRSARHDGVAMCLLRKDIQQTMPLRREHQVARNRRLLILVWILVLQWWVIGWLFF
jgi:hypothetical protein